MTEAAGQTTGGRDVLRVVIVGHVDHGKSTLIGRLLHDTGSLPAGKVEAVAESSRRRGMPFEWAFVTDALRAERDQGVTIDVSHIWFRTAVREYVLLDAPGHREFLRNMVTGAAQSDAALLVVDAAEGVRDQSRRHAYLLALLGHRQIAVAVNKMDLVGFAEDRFAAVARDIAQHLETLGLTASSIIPVAARDGDNVAARAERMGWYRGPTLLETLARFTPTRRGDPDRPLRIPVQDVYKFDERRIVVGRVEAGRLAVGDEILFSPANKVSHVASIESWAGPAPAAVAAGGVVGFTLDEQVFVERGDVASHTDHPPILTDVFDARLFWLSPEPLRLGVSYAMRLGTAEVPVVIERLKRVVDLAERADRASGEIERDSVAEVTLRARRLVALDDHRAGEATGRFVLVAGGVVAGGGLVDMSAWPDQRKLMVQKATNLTGVAHRVDAEARLRRNGHRGGVLWLTGLSGAGKSTLAVAAEQRLFQLGYQTYLLDGDNVRRGLNANLGFSPDDRAENIRRVGEVAALFAEAGMIAITAFISPYRSDRERARQAAHRAQPALDFHEVYVKADLATCEARDPKGLYKKARAGSIPQFTGISAPYEPPEAPELEVDTAALDVDRSIERIVDYVRARFPLRAR